MLTDLLLLHLSLELVILFVLFYQRLVNIPGRLRAAAQNELTVLDIADGNQLVAHVVDGQFHLHGWKRRKKDKTLKNN